MPVWVLAAPENRIKRYVYFSSKKKKHETHAQFFYNTHFIRTVWRPLCVQFSDFYSKRSLSFSFCVKAKRQLILQQLGTRPQVGPDQSQHPVTQSKSPTWVAEPQVLEPSVLPASVCISRKQNPKPEPGMAYRYSEWGCENLNQHPKLPGQVPVSQFIFSFSFTWVVWTCWYSRLPLITGIIYRRGETKSPEKLRLPDTKEAAHNAVSWWCTCSRNSVWAPQ